LDVVKRMWQTDPASALANLRQTLALDPSLETLEDIREMLE
jgi:hypothetical protein